jgi:hypothetical protein
MKKVVLFLNIVIVLLILNGCSTISGSAFKEIDSFPANKALIYFYRENSLTGAIFGWTIIVNGKEIVSLSNNEYYPYICNPGITKVKGKIGFYSPEIEFNIEGGKTYFVKVVASSELGTGISSIQSDFVISLVDNNIGRKEILDNILEK